MRFLNIKASYTAAIGIFVCVTYLNSAEPITVNTDDSLEQLVIALANNDSEESVMSIVTELDASVLYWDKNKPILVIQKHSGMSYVAFQSEIRDGALFSEGDIVLTQGVSQTVQDDIVLWSAVQTIQEYPESGETILKLVTHDKEKAANLILYHYHKRSPLVKWQFK